MRMIHDLRLPILCAILFTGCGGSMNVHDPQSWTPPADTERATADWDVAEGICDKIASGTELTEEEKAEIEFDQEMQMMYARMIGDMGSQIADMANQVGGDASYGVLGQIIAGGIAFSGGFGGATAEEDKKEKSFLECMDRLGWEMKDSG